MSTSRCRYVKMPSNSVDLYIDTRSQYCTKNTHTACLAPSVILRCNVLGSNPYMFLLFWWISRFSYFWFTISRSRMDTIRRENIIPVDVFHRVDNKTKQHTHNLEESISRSRMDTMENAPSYTQRKSRHGQHALCGCTNSRGNCDIQKTQKIIQKKQIYNSSAYWTHDVEPTISG